MSHATSSDRPIVVLGGGPAGLAAAWALETLGRDYVVLEGSPVPGGNARTLSFGEYRCDTGPHRFHDRDPEVTRQVVELLAGDLHEVDAPSRIYWNGRFVDFPLRPLQVFTSGGATAALRAALGFVAARLRRDRAATATDFESFAYATFGRPIASAFLVPFSEKLWGLPVAELSPDIAGRRLPGFRFRAIVKEALFGVRPEHLEGRFLYPRGGYGRIAEAMAARLGPGRLRCGCTVTRLLTAGDRVVAVEYASEGRSSRREVLEAAAVVNTLPITALVQMMDPPPPPETLAAASTLRFRDLVLAVLFLDQPNVSEAACTYFPARDVEFTRAHEPRNRCPTMSPAGKTSLVVEFPCFEGDAVWRRPDDELVAQLTSRLDAYGLVRASRIEGSAVVRLRKAYPVYAKGHRETAGRVLAHLDGYRNLATLGRGGAFFYGHVHDFIADGFAAARAIVAAVASEEDSRSDPASARRTHEPAEGSGLANSESACAAKRACAARESSSGAAINPSTRSAVVGSTK